MENDNMMNVDSSDKPKVSNLTKNLQSLTNGHESSKFQELSPTQKAEGDSSAPNNPPSYNSINRFIPTPNLSLPTHLSMPSVPHPQLHNINHQTHTQDRPTSHSLSHFSYDSSKRDSINYIPSSHNTPNMVSSSYSSNHSYNKYNFRPSHSIPTTNVSIDNNVNYHRNSGPFEFQPSLPQHMNQQMPQSLPQSLPQSVPQSMPQSMPHPLPRSHSSQSYEAPNIGPSLNYITEPDHYMTYHEFFANLNQDTNEEEHINIVEYPVNDLILMLSCLLTKIIEANDKLHPNHFDNTIAIRQKMKEEKRIRKLERHQGKSTTTSQGVNINESVIEGDSSDEEDEEDEMKNKYLANVLAFHGTNVPGISLHAYLSRVLKYCPVTNEVFLSLLVYFDRIAKKANNLKKDNEKDGEQLFVMDSYNIHRLIISGITVSSKFFSDIFYKNLRYAKVGGLPLEELNYLELQFLLLLDFKLMISVEDLQNYGDLLLRFWKREQITNELVSHPLEQDVAVNR